MIIFVWIFPLLFIFHDMEEIIGFKSWFARNGELISKRPIIAKIHEIYSTEGMAVAVTEEFLLCILICIISIATNWYALWLGGFIAFAIHLILHIGQVIVLRKYIPALITSIVCLPISAYFIYRSIELLEYNTGYILLFSFIGLIIVGVNLKFAHFLMKKYTLFSRG